MFGIQPSSLSNNSSLNSIQQILNTAQETQSNDVQESASSQASEQATSTNNNNLIKIVTETREDFLALCANFRTEFSLFAQAEADLGQGRLPKGTTEEVMEYVNRKLDRYCRLMELQQALPGEAPTEQMLIQLTSANKTEADSATTGRAGKADTERKDASKVDRDN